jgi:hypothetical protein
MYQIMFLISDNDSDDVLSDTNSEPCIEIKQKSLEVTRSLNDTKSLHYLGVPSDCKFIINLLEKKIKFAGNFLCSKNVITLILRKVRRNFTFKTLSHMYGISESYASRLYSTFLPIISESMKDFVKLLPIESVKLHLPIAFWARFKKVYIIIDTFEIEINKPQNAYDQSETYSDYKNCNTVKYLIGISPDGTIMFISKGFVGRDSDQEITIISCFVESMPSGVEVMSDRGFKNIETILKKNNCSLVRPPSVGKDEILSKELSRLGKKIASLRSHVERSIGRLREFRHLDIHSGVAATMLSVVDDAVIVACGLINCHSPLLRM